MKIYTIRNSFLQANIKDFGAELCSLKKNDEDIEYIWQGDAKYWNRHAPVLFPIVGKLLDDKYIYKEKTYSMGQHGFARDSLFEVVEKEDDKITLKLENTKESYKKYPFYFKLFITYTLKNSSLIVSYKVVNKSNDKIYFSIGAHPAFNWPLENEEKQDCYFAFKNINSLERFPLTNHGVDKNSVKIDLKENRLFLDETIFKDDALVLNDKSIDTICFKNTKNNRFIKIDFKGFPYLGLWSKPTGAPFICIEPWHGVADFIEHNQKLEEKRGINILNSDETFESFYIIEI
ncbi:MAG: aldose 1-epimerase family protein [Halarcobacter sp.]